MVKVTGLRSVGASRVGSNPTSCTNHFLLDSLWHLICNHLDQLNRGLREFACVDLWQTTLDTKLNTTLARVRKMRFLEAVGALHFPSSLK